MDPCRKLTLLKPEGTRRVGKQFDVAWVSWGIWAWATGDVIHGTAESGVQFWKRLGFKEEDEEEEEEDEEEEG